MQEYIQTEEKDYARDITTRALINTNRRALSEHKRKKEDALRLDKLERNVQDIMAMMLDIRQAVRELGASKQ
jgi:hypothetical protein